MIPFAQYPPFFRIIPEVSLIKVVGGAAFVYAIFYLLTQSNKSKFKPLEAKEAKFCLLFMLFVLISGFANYSPRNANPITTFLLYPVFFFTTYIFLDKPKKLEKVYFLIIISMLLACYRGFKEYFLYSKIYSNYRPESVLGDPNYFALSLLLVLPFSYYLFNYYKNKWVKYFGVFSSLIFLIMIFLTSSRGAIIGLSAMFVAILFNSKKKLKIILLIGICVMLLIPLVPQKALNRISSMTGLYDIIESSGEKLSTSSEDISYGDITSTRRRYLLLMAGIKMTLDHWVTGVGFGYFRRYLPDYYNEFLGSRQIAHNMYIQITAELGIVGFSLFSLMIVFVFKSLLKIERIAKENRITKYEYFGKALKISLIGFLVASFFLTAEFEKSFWLAIFLVISLRRVMKAEYPELFQRSSHRSSVKLTTK